MFWLQTLKLRSCRGSDEGRRGKATTPTSITQQQSLRGRRQAELTQEPGILLLESVLTAWRWRINPVSTAADARPFTGCLSRIVQASRNILINLFKLHILNAFFLKNLNLRKWILNKVFWHVFPRIKCCYLKYPL